MYSFLKIKRTQLTSFPPAYRALCKHYGWWIMLPHDQFQHLIDPANQVCTLLASHWIALKQIMAIITETEHRATVRPPPARGGDLEIGIIRWLRFLNRHVDPEFQPYNAWPIWVEAQLDRDRSFFGKTM